MSEFVVSTGLLAFAAPAFAQTELHMGQNGFGKPVIRFSSLGLPRDPSCTEKEWERIQNEVVPMNYKVINFLVGESPQATIRCDFEFLDWYLVTGKFNDLPMEIDLENRIVTLRSPSNTCGRALCGPAKKLFEELQRRDLKH